ncbi:MAG: endopeptidase, partial [Acidobacteriota bacterium]
RGYLQTHRADLGLDMSELGEQRIGSHDDGQVVQIFARRQFDGIPVRGSQISAVISHGNLILMGMQKWGDRGKFDNNRAPLDIDQVMIKVESYLSPLKVQREWAKPELVYLPMNTTSVRGDISYRYQLAWSVKVVVGGDMGQWEVLVNAHTGEILANQDLNHYAEAKGGVQPVTNDGVVPDGVEVAGEPMPFMEVGSQITTTGGNYTLSGSQTARFYGPYVNMADNCGTDSLTQSGGIDWGTSGGTDCTTPGFGGAGNTHSSRDGFYEINKLKELARGQLPNNNWLQGRLTANMNINQSCNAFWNGSTINFYRSGGGCSNTGEIAGVFVHEWGHGMDDFDVEGTVASPSGEGIADVYTALRLNTSCIGRNFLSSPCSGNGDPCISCTGVRDIDYEQRQSGQPHTYTWSNQNCGGSVHCVGAVYAEAVWSLWKRKLQSAPYNYDNNTAQEIVTRMTFIGAGAVSNWFSGGPPNGGCAASSGYQNYLAADDDNGNLNDGTPHMQAIYEAFNDQQIACNNPTVQDSGCAGIATSAPSVTGTAGNQSASLSWGAVSGAAEYDVFRTEGVFGCDFGKVKIGSTAGTSFNDNSGLQNGREYYYVVIPKGSSDACFGPSSACTTVVPASAPDFTVALSPASQSIRQNGSGTATCTVASQGGYT